MKCGLIGAAAILVLLAISLEHVHAALPFIDPETVDDCWCIFKDDPLVTTCDKATISLVGEGSYKAAKYGNRGDECYFRIEVDIRNENNPQFPMANFLEKVRINVNTARVFIDQLESWVDGGQRMAHDRTIPGNVLFQAGSSGVAPWNLYWDGDYLTFESPDCGIKVAFLPQPDKSELRIFMAKRYFSSPTGICGNYDGYSSTDLYTADGLDVGGQSDRNILISNSYRVIPK